MKDFLIEMADILEEDEVKESDEFRDFEEWDSLTALSIVALAGDKYKVTITGEELSNLDTIKEIFNLIKEKQGEKVL